MRVEFVAIDTNGDGDEMDDDEGFFRIYRSPDPSWVGSYGGSGVAGPWTRSCGDVHAHPDNGNPWFISADNHRELYENGAVLGGEMSAWQDHAALLHGGSPVDWNAVKSDAVNSPTARCFLGGDRRLEADNRTFDPWDGAGDAGWLRRADFMPDAVMPAAVAGRDDEPFLVPLDTDYNASFRGVLFFEGLVGVSGVLNGRVTIVSSDNIVLLDDFTYSVPANAARCNDIAGFLAAGNYYVADNSLNSPKVFPSEPGAWRTYDDTSSEFIDGIIMTLQTSFTAENWGSGPTAAEMCETTVWGRGCLYLTGGVIQQTRGAVGRVTGHGYLKRYAYDSNARFCPPPHFPTTGKYLRNRYYQVNSEAFQDKSIFFAELK
jgi:hypothetical protein